MEPCLPRNKQVMGLVSNLSPALENIPFCGTEVVLNIYWWSSDSLSMILDYVYRNDFERLPLKDAGSRAFKTCAP